MDWSDAIAENVTNLKPVTVNDALKERVVSLMDLTRLKIPDTEADVAHFATLAQTSYGNVAAVCVYPQYVRLMADNFVGSNIKVAAVANFPKGETKLENVLFEINQAISDGAQEIDLVFPYERYLAGEKNYCQQFVTACKAACGEQVILKVILETGVLGEPALIADAAYDVFAAGADFIKSSTGKTSPGVTLEAATTMLLVIKHLSRKSSRLLGLKFSGGIHDLQQAGLYIELVDQIMGRVWTNPKHFRIGASKLIESF